MASMLPSIGTKIPLKLRVCFFRGLGLEVGISSDWALSDIMEIGGSGPGVSEFEDGGSRPVVSEFEECGSGLGCLRQGQI